jgi:hypothetical protein
MVLTPATMPRLPRTASSLVFCGGLRSDFDLRRHLTASGPETPPRSPNCVQEMRAGGYTRRSRQGQVVARCKFQRRQGGGGGTPNDGDGRRMGANLRGVARGKLRSSRSRVRFLQRAAASSPSAAVTVNRQSALVGNKPPIHGQKNGGKKISGHRGWESF